MISKKTLLGSVASIAVVGTMAFPTLASAHPGNGTAADGQRAEQGRGSALATALGVTPEALQAAVKAAHESVAKPTDPKDATARQAYHDAINAAIAANLGIDVAKLQTALQSVTPAPREDQGKGPGEDRGQHLGELAKALNIDTAKLAAATKTAREQAGTPPKGGDQAARDAYKQSFDTALAAALGINVTTLQNAQETLRTEHKAEATEHLNEMLAKLVERGVITQAQADEAKAKIAAGADPREVMQALAPAKGNRGENHGPRPDNQGQHGGHGQRPAGRPF